MEQGSIADMQPYITAFMRIVELIWQHSRHYCSAPRIIVLLQEVNNMLIDHVSRLFFLKKNVENFQINELKAKIEMKVTENWACFFLSQQLHVNMGRMPADCQRNQTCIAAFRDR